MRVNVFIALDDGKMPHELLVLPYGPTAVIPTHLRHLDWQNLATTMTDDKLLGRASAEIDASIARDGYALVLPTG